MTINHTRRATAAASPTSRARTVLGAALLSGGLALAGLGLASAANASPFSSGPLPEPTGPNWIHRGLIVPAHIHVDHDFNPFGDGPLPEPNGPEWIHSGPTPDHPAPSPDPTQPPWRLYGQDRELQAGLLGRSFGGSCTSGCRS